MDTPFWQKSFLLEDQNVLNKVLSTKIKEAWIDTIKGLDVFHPAEDSDEEPEEIVAEPIVAKPVEPVEAVQMPSFKEIRGVSMDEEL